VHTNQNDMTMTKRKAVRLPKPRFPNDQDEVEARQVGERVVLESADEWSRDFALGTWDGEIERPRSISISKGLRHRKKVR